MIAGVLTQEVDLPINVLENLLGPKTCSEIARSTGYDNDPYMREFYGMTLKLVHSYRLADLSEKASESLKSGSRKGASKKIDYEKCSEGYTPLFERG